MKPSNAASKELTDRTHRVWQPRTRRPLTNEDARQIVENITGFFSILAEWSRSLTQTPVDSSDVLSSKGKMFYDR
jgi:hypothetical protein